MDGLWDFFKVAGGFVVAASVAWYGGIQFIVGIRELLKLAPWPWVERLALTDRLKAFVVICALGLPVGLGYQVWEQQKEIASLERGLEEARTGAAAVKASVQGSKEEARKEIASMNYPLTGKGLLTAAKEAPGMMHYFKTLEIEPSEAEVIEAVQGLSGRNHYKLVNTLVMFITYTPRAKAAILSMKDTYDLVVETLGKQEPLDRRKLCAPALYRYFSMADQQKVMTVCQTVSDRDFSDRFKKVASELVGIG